MRIKRSLPVLLTLALLCMLSSYAGSAYAESLVGTVRNSQTSAPVEGAIIRLNTGEAAMTGGDGTFRIDGLSDSQFYDVTVAHSSYYHQIYVYVYAEEYNPIGFSLSPIANPEADVARDAFGRADNVDLATTEDTNQFPWLEGNENPADPQQGIFGQKLVLPVQSVDPWPNGMLGPTPDGFLPANFDMTFTTTWLSNTAQHEWQRYGINYRGRYPNVGFVGDSASAQNGGYTFMILPDPRLVYGLVLKSPTAANIVLLQKSATGLAGVDWTQPQQVRIKVDGSRHQGWVNGVKVYDVTNGENMGGGHFTLTHWLCGATFDNINIARVEANGRIGGEIYSSANPSVKIAGATVTLDNGRTAVTNNDGEYLIGFLAPGTYSVTVSAPGYFPATTSDVAVDNGLVDVDLGLATIPPEFFVTDTFGRADSTNLGVTEDSNHYPWLAATEPPGNSAEQISFGELYLPVQTTSASMGPSVSDYLPLDFEMTVKMTAQLYGREWETYGVSYRNSAPNVDQAGGYRFLIPPDPYNPWGVILKNPAGANIVLLSKAQIGITDFTVPHTLQLKAIGNRHMCWIDGNLKYDVLDGGNVGGGYVTFCHESTGVRWDDLSINGLRFGLSIKGNVHDSANPSTKIPGAAVFLNTGVSTTTDVNGNYVFRALSEGTYTVTASAAGYQPKTTTNLLVDETHPLVTADMPLDQAAATDRVLDTFTRADNTNLGNSEDGNHYPWIAGIEPSPNPLEQITGQKLVLPIQTTGAGVGPAIGGGFLPADVDMSFTLTIQDGGWLPYESQVGVAYGLPTSVLGGLGFGLGIDMHQAAWYFYAPDGTDPAVPLVALHNKTHGSLPALDWGVPHTVRVVAIGTRHMAWVDNTLLYSQTSSVTSGGYTSFWHTYDGAQIDNVNVTASRYALKIEGEVYDAANPSLKIANAAVSLDSGQSTTTNGSGQYTLFVAPGTYEMTVSALAYYEDTVSDIVVTDSNETVNVGLDAVPAGLLVHDTFSRADNIDLGVTEDPNHLPWLEGAEKAGDPSQGIAGQKLVLPAQTDPYDYVSGPSIGGFIPGGFDMTFKTAWLANPAPPHEWERFGINYRGAAPNVYWAGSDTANNGGYSLLIIPNPANTWCMALKDPSGANIVLLAKSANGLSGVNWALPQTLRVRVIGNQHQCWVNGTLVYDVTDNSNVGCGFITFSHWIGGASFDDLNVLATDVLQGTDIPNAKTQPDGTLVRIAGAVTAVFGDAAYVETLDRVSGIRVEPANSLSSYLGKEVTVTGVTGTLGLERLITASLVSGGDANDLDPLGLVNKSLSTSGSSLSTIGLLTTVWGTVTHKEAASGSESYLYIDDGSGIPSGIEGILGVRVGPVETTLDVSDYVRATGIAGAFESGEVVVRTLRPRSAGEVAGTGP